MWAGRLGTVTVTVFKFNLINLNKSSFQKKGLVCSPGGIMMTMPSVEVAEVSFKLPLSVAPSREHGPRLRPGDNLKPDREVSESNQVTIPNVLLLRF